MDQKIQTKTKQKKTNRSLKTVCKSGGSSITCICTWRSWYEGIGQFVDFSSDEGDHESDIQMNQLVIVLAIIAGKTEQ